MAGIGSALARGVDPVVDLSVEGLERNAVGVELVLQWRIVFRWGRDGADAVEVTDYH